MVTIDLSNNLCRHSIVLLISPQNKRYQTITILLIMNRRVLHRYGELGGFTNRSTFLCIVANRIDLLCDNKYG